MFYFSPLSILLCLEPSGMRIWSLCLCFPAHFLLCQLSVWPHQVPWGIVQSQSHGWCALTLQDQRFQRVVSLVKHYRDASQHNEMLGFCFLSVLSFTLILKTFCFRIGVYHTHLKPASSSSGPATDPDQQSDGSFSVCGLLRSPDLPASNISTPDPPANTC